MQVVKQSWQFTREPNGEDILKQIEEAGRTCYKSEDKMTPESARAFVRKALDMGHHSVIEHANIGVRIITDRGVTHEIVRHRIASYSQESTRYCNYSKAQFGNHITVILPVWFYDVPEDYHQRELKTLLEQTPEDDKVNPYVLWRESCEASEYYYFSLLNSGQSPQQARSVLPNSLKTEIVMTCNVREWRHFFNLRCSKAAHPQMRELALSMLKGFKEIIPVIFDDLYSEG
mgnify:CR=1 FL=1